MGTAVKLSEHEADHSPQTGAEVTDARSSIYTPGYVIKAWCVGTGANVYNRGTGLLNNIHIN
jgi:hypothetical protein